MPAHIDINCDVGEGMGWDDQVIPFISSANIACGFHAGDRDILQRTVETCLANAVAIGAHPSLNDRANFGRVDILGKSVDEKKLYDEMIEQLSLISDVCRGLACNLFHVKPHGALYNRAARDPLVADIVCKAVYDFGPALVIYGLSGSVMKSAAEGYGLRFVSEAFADRRYNPDGSLTSRSEPGALIEDAEECIAQVKLLIKEGVVATVPPGKKLRLIADTICIHGDGINAPAISKSIFNFLKREHIALSAPHQ